MDQKNKNAIDETKKSIYDQKDLTNKGIALFFEGDDYHVFLYKKTERIIAAIYLVTNLLKDEECIKWETRKKSVALLSDISMYARSQGSMRKEVMLNLKKYILEILSFFDVAYTSSIVGEMNYAVLQKELNNLLSVIDSGSEYVNQAWSGNNSLILSHNFFDQKQPRQPSKKQEVFKGHNKRHKLSFSSDIAENSPVGQYMQPGGGVSFVHQNLPSALPSSLNLGSQEKAPSSADRRQIILKLIKERIEVQIKDVSLIIKGCSEKTLQRELSALVLSGVLKKEGDRRWSKYRMA